MSDVTMLTLAEMERHATLLAGSLGLVPVSPHIARITALEADVARLLAENVRLAAANAVLQRGAEIIAAADVPTPSRPAFPARALARQHQAIGLTTEFS
jgi:hypothetical protein